MDANRAGPAEGGGDEEENGFQQKLAFLQEVRSFIFVLTCLDAASAVFADISEKK